MEQQETRSILEIVKRLEKDDLSLYIEYTNKDIWVVSISESSLKNFYSCKGSSLLQTLRHCYLRYINSKRSDTIRDLL